MSARNYLARQASNVWRPAIDLGRRGHFRQRTAPRSRREFARQSSTCCQLASSWTRAYPYAQLHRSKLNTLSRWPLLFAGLTPGVTRNPSSGSATRQTRPRIATILTLSMRSCNNLPQRPTVQSPTAFVTSRAFTAWQCRGRRWPPRAELRSGRGWHRYVSSSGVDVQPDASHMSVHGQWSRRHPARKELVCDFCHLQRVQGSAQTVADLPSTLHGRATSSCE